MKVFLDTNIPMYASGKEHKYKKSCQDIILSVASGRLTAYTDVEVFQEILHKASFSTVLIAAIRHCRKNTGWLSSSSRASHATLGKNFCAHCRTRMVLP